MREGNVIARVNPTPGTVKISKTKHDITVDCTKEGFQKASYFNKSDIAGMTVGNLILGGAIGWAIDSATGSDNKYTSAVHIELVPKDAAPADMPAAKPVSAPSSITTPTS